MRDTVANELERDFRPLLEFFIFQLDVEKQFAIDYSKFPSPIGVLYISILSSAALIITGLQSRIAVQNLIRLFTI